MSGMPARPRRLANSTPGCTEKFSVDGYLTVMSAKAVILHRLKSVSYEQRKRKLPVSCAEGTSFTPCMSITSAKICL